MRLAALFIALVSLGGCAHTPDVSVYYFPAKTAVDVKVTRLLACTSDNQVFSSQTVTATAVNTADLAQAPIPLDLGLLNSDLADTSFTAEFHGDGRLKGINVTEAGKAGEIIKSAVSLVKLVLPLVGLEASNNRYSPELCKMIAEEKDKVLTLKYEGQIEPTSASKKGDLWEVPLAPESRPFYARAVARSAELQPLDLHIKLDDIAAPEIPSQGQGADGVTFRYPAQVKFVLLAADTPLWDDSLPIAQLGTSGWLPIARAPAFGKTTTTINLNEDGSLNKVVYTSEQGTQAATDAAGEVVGLLDGASDTERAAAAEAEQKRIKAERDLLRCRADPQNC